VGPEDVGAAVRDRGAAPAQTWTILSSPVAGALVGCDVVVAAGGLRAGDGDSAVMRAILDSPPASLRRLVVVTTTAWLGDRDDPLRAGSAASSVAVARSLALRLAPRATVNTIAVAGGFDPARSALAALAAQPDTRTLAHWIDWFCGAGNDYVTGQTINLCGGATLLSSLSV
jgi:hypothetical protein